MGATCAAAPAQYARRPVDGHARPTPHPPAPPPPASPPSDEETGRARARLQTNVVLGQGAYKAVYKAFDEVDGIEVAWNQVKIPSNIRKEEFDRLYAEVELLKSLQHKNLIQFHSSWIDTKAGCVNFITEFFTSGNLRQYSKKHKHCDVKAVINWCRQILRGLLYLHSHDPPIIHRDLKCENVFVNGNHGEIKIGDLGLATLVKQSSAAQSVIGTPEFMAPELYDEKYDEKVDIYSFGMCLLELVTHAYPYCECENAAQIYKRVTSGRPPQSMDKVKDKALREFIEMCIGPADGRPSARELLENPLFAQESADAKGAGIPRSVSVEDRLNRANSPPLTKRSATEGGQLAAMVEPARKTSNTMQLKLRSEMTSESKLNLSLRMCEQDGTSRLIEFPFDLEHDTAADVASEMVEHLSLTDDEEQRITHMISSEVSKHAIGNSFAGGGGIPKAHSASNGFADGGEGAAGLEGAARARHSLSDGQLERHQPEGGGGDAAAGPGSLGSDESSPEHLREPGSGDDGGAGAAPSAAASEEREWERDVQEMKDMRARHAREIEDMKLRHVQEEQDCLEKQRTKKAERSEKLERSTSDSTKAAAVKSRMKDMEAKALQGLGSTGSIQKPATNGYSNKAVHSNGNGNGSVVMANGSVSSKS